MRIPRARQQATRHVKTARCFGEWLVPNQNEPPSYVQLGTLGSIAGSSDDFGILSQAIYLESRVAAGELAGAEKGSIGAVIMNRWQVVNGYQTLWTGSGRGSSVIRPDVWGTPGASIRSVVFNPSQFGIVERKPDGSVGLRGAEEARLTSALNAGGDSTECLSLFQSVVTAWAYLDEKDNHRLYATNGLILTSFNSFAPSRSAAPYEHVIGSYGSNNVFYGIPAGQGFFNLGQQVFVTDGNRRADEGIPSPRQGGGRAQ